MTDETTTTEPTEDGQTDGAEDVTPATEPDLIVETPEPDEADA
jgi:hypothetical protein